MILKWAIVILLGYFVYKRFIALPAGKDDDQRPNIREKSESKKNSDDDDYIDFEEVD